MALVRESTGAACINGELFGVDEARVSPFDHGFLYGDGLFETMRTYRGAIFRLEAHLARLAHGLSVLEIAGAPEAATLAEWTRATLRRSGLEEAQCRITVTRGVGRRGLDPRGCDAPTVLVAALPLRPYPAEVYERGIAATLLWPRATVDRPPPSVKSTSYQRSVLGRLEVARRDADEGLFLDESGNVTEGTTSNVFAVLDGQLVTPAEGCLAGITRSEVLAIAGRAGQAASETAISPADLGRASEIFVTSTLAEILAVTRLDGRAVGAGAVGPITRRLASLFREETLRPSLG